MPQLKIQIWGLVGCIGLFIFLVDCLRRNKLKEKYSLLWFLTVITLVIFSVWGRGQLKLASILGIYYPPAALLLVLIAFLLMILIHFSIVISSLLAKKQELAQSIALLDLRLRELESKK